MRPAPICICYVALTLLALIAPAPATAWETYGLPSLEAISAACEEGRIDRAEALALRVRAIKTPESLPSEFRLQGGELKCATPLVLQAYEELEALGRGDAVDDLRARPTNLPLLRTTTHFMIHYTLSGGDATTEAYVDVIEGACEIAWTAFHTTYTWDVPPTDGTAGGGNNLTDIYIHVLGAGTMGMAERESLAPPDPPYSDYTGFMHINTNLTANESRVTTAHEYMHIIQYGYNANSNNVSWFGENCAMMGEEYAYDTINDYRGYLPPWFGTIWVPLYTSGDQYEYSQITWPMYMTERHAAGLVEDLWDRMQWVYAYFEICEDAFAPYGCTHDQAYHELRTWGVYTGYRHDGQHFSEAGTWNPIYYPDHIHSSYPTGDQHPGAGKAPDRLGASFQAFLPQSGNDDNVLRVHFNGPACTIAVTLFRKLEGIAGHTEYYVTLDANGDGTLDVPGFDQSEWVLMLVTMSLYCGADNQDYVYSAETTVGSGAVDASLAETRVRFFPNVPNPLTDRTVLSYALAERSAVELRVVDAAGRLVRTLFAGEQHPGRYEILWDRTDEAGRAVESGVYYAIARAGDEELARQMTVLR